jgi:hypothetical protein
VPQQVGCINEILIICIKIYDFFALVIMGVGMNKRILLRGELGLVDELGCQPE